MLARFFHPVNTTKGNGEPSLGEPSVGAVECLALAGLVLIPLAFSLVWSHFKFFWSDELLEYLSDTRPTVASVIAGQWSHPFSIEPPLYHLLLHGMLRALPSRPETAMRLPAMLLFVVVQGCLYRIVRRLTRDPFAALLACAMPFMLVTFIFDPEARVYELLAASFATSVVAYQVGLASHERVRRLAFTALFLALGASVLGHYYGVLLPLPFAAAEAMRCWRARHLQALPGVAIAGSLALFLLNLPFLPALHGIQSHYYDTSQAAWDRVPFTYAWIFGHNDIYDHDRYSNGVRIVAYCMVGVLAAAALAVIFQIRKNRPAADAEPVLHVLLLGLLFPCVNVAVGHVVTHAYWPRYSVAAAVSAGAILSLAATPLLRNRWVAFCCIAVVVGVGCQAAMQHIHKEERLFAIWTRHLSQTDNLSAVSAATSDPHIYVQHLGNFMVLYRYASADVRQRLVLFDSNARVHHWGKQTPSSRFTESIGASTSVPVTTYEELSRSPGPHLLLLFNDSLEEWIGHEINALGVVRACELLGHPYGADLYRVTFGSAQGPGDVRCTVSPDRRWNW